MKIEDLYFGVCYFSNREMATCNLFEMPSIRKSVASYIIHKDNLDYKIKDPLFYCFGDVQGRVEWEWAVDAINARDMNQSSQKVDVYSMYIKPNKDYLMILVNQIPITEAKKYIRSLK